MPPSDTTGSVQDPLLEELDRQAVATCNLLTNAADCIVCYADWDASETPELAQERLALLERFAADLREVLQQFPEVTNG